MSVKLHGATKYAHDGCRCEVCTVAHKDRILKRRKERELEAKSIGIPISVKHGSSCYNNWGCRCDECSEAHKERCKKRRKKS